MTVATARSGAGHYGGTLLTFPEPGAAGVVRTIRVVDGQQRLTTVSIFLAAVAERLGPDGDSDGWTAEIIRTDRLTNPGKRPDQIRKLRLQGGDEDEYRKVLAGDGDGAGAVTQAWRTIRRLVAQNDVGGLLRGLQRLRVVSIGLDANKDPQQIFESLNATERQELAADGILLVAGPGPLHGDRQRRACRRSGSGWRVDHPHVAGGGSGVRRALAVHAPHGSVLPNTGLDVNSASRPQPTHGFPDAVR